MKKTVKAPKKQKIEPETLFVNKENWDQHYEISTYTKDQLDELISDNDLTDGDQVVEIKVVSIKTLKKQLV